MKEVENMTPEDVKSLPLDEFERLFNFLPTDALDKWGFAMTGKRMDSMTREMIKAGIIDQPDLSDVVME